MKAGLPSSLSGWRWNVSIFMVSFSDDGVVLGACNCDTKLWLFLGFGFVLTEDRFEILMKRDMDEEMNGNKPENRKRSNMNSQSACSWRSTWQTDCQSGVCFMSCVRLSEQGVLHVDIQPPHSTKFYLMEASCIVVCDLRYTVHYAIVWL